MQTYSYKYGLKKRVKRPWPLRYFFSNLYIYIIHFHFLNPITYADTDIKMYKALHFIQNSVQVFTRSNSGLGYFNFNWILYWILSSFKDDSASSFSNGFSQWQYSIYRQHLLPLFPLCLINQCYSAIWILYGKLYCQSIN